MCGCGPTFVCARCSGDYRHDWRVAFDPEPESTEERAFRLVNEHMAAAVRPAIQAAKP